MTDGGVMEASKKEGFVWTVNPTFSSTDFIQRLLKLTEADYRMVGTEHMRSK